MWMTTIQRSYRFRAEPTAQQAVDLQRWMGAARWTWNWSLSWRTKGFRRRAESRTGVDASREITRLKALPGFKWLKAVPSTVITQKLRDQDAAFQAFFAGRTRYPRFASKRRKPVRALRFQLDQRQIHRSFVAGEQLTLPGVGAMKLRWSRIPGGVPKMVTVRLRPDGHWEVSFMVEDAAPASTIGQHEAVGIDVGLKDLVVTDRGQRFGNPKALAGKQRRLKRAQRALSRKVGSRKGETPSNRYRRQQARVARLHQRVRDARTNTLHQITTTLIRENQAICVEDLNVRGLCRGRLAKAFGDAAVGELRRQLTYKADWHGRSLHVIDRWFPSSKTCSHCGSVNETLTLGQRQWRCTTCDTHHDRDVNAAINLRTAGLAGTQARGGRHPSGPRHQAVDPGASIETRISQAATATHGRVGVAA